MKISIFPTVISHIW